MFAVSVPNSIGLLKAFLFVIATISCVCNASAEFSGYFGAAVTNYETEGERSGSEVALGISFTSRRTATTLALYPFQGFFYGGDPPVGFRRETFDDGRTVCRNLRNGQFSNKSKCNPSIESEYTPSVEFIQSLGEHFSLGVGYRGGDAPRAFGMLLFTNDSANYLGVRGGKNYIGISIGKMY